MKAVVAKNFDYCGKVWWEVIEKLSYVFVCFPVFLVFLAASVAFLPKTRLLCRHFVRIVTKVFTIYVIMKTISPNKSLLYIVIRVQFVDKLI